jgi:serine/threonine protein kinase
VNLLVDDNHTVKVCDFGLSKTFEEQEQNKIKGGCGTILYMAPEVINNMNYSFKADVFSFGVVLYELLYMREHPESNFTLEGYKQSLTF